VLDLKPEKPTSTGLFNEVMISVVDFKHLEILLSGYLIVLAMNKNYSFD